MGNCLMAKNTQNMCCLCLNRTNKQIYCIACGEMTENLNLYVLTYCLMRSFSSLDIIHHQTMSMTYIYQFGIIDIYFAPAFL